MIPASMPPHMILLPSERHNPPQASPAAWIVVGGQFACVNRKVGRCVHGAVAKRDGLSDSKAREAYQGAEELGRYPQGRHLWRAAFHKLLDVVGGCG